MINTNWWFRFKSISSFFNSTLIKWLEEKVDWVFSNFSKAQTIALNGQNYIKNILLQGNNFTYHFKNIVDIVLKDPNPKTVMDERDS